MEEKPFCIYFYTRFWYTICRGDPMLKNKLNIDNFSELASVEEKSTKKKALYLIENI